jgi:hypothetical protein
VPSRRLTTPQVRTTEGTDPTRSANESLHHHENRLQPPGPPKLHLSLHLVLRTFKHPIKRSLVLIRQRSPKRYPHSPFLPCTWDAGFLRPHGKWPLNGITTPLLLSPTAEHPACRIHHRRVTAPPADFPSSHPPQSRSVPTLPHCRPTYTCLEICHLLFL